MDVRIGVTYTAKEIDLELGDDADADDVQRLVEDAVKGDASVLWISDKKGKRVGIPSEKLAWVEIGSADSERRIGFGA